MRGNPPISSVWAGATWGAAGATPSIRGIRNSIRRPTCGRSSTARLACPAQAIVITGGEPLLYPLGVLTETLHGKGLQIFLETSGTHPFSGVLRLGMSVAQAAAAARWTKRWSGPHELKVIVESESDFEWAERNAARVRPECMLYLQPEWSVAERVMPAMVEYAKTHPKWNISIQTHKYMHIP